MAPIQRNHTDNVPGELLDQRTSAWKRGARRLVPEPIARDFGSNLLQRRMRARQTCVDSSDLHEIETAVARRTRLSLPEMILKSTKKQVAAALREAISDSGLEKVIESLFRASGAVSQTQAKNSGKPGDVDVMAVYDLRIGNQESIVRVAYQVKQHEKVSNEHGIQQLVDRMEADSSIDKGCFVTLASEITAAARKRAEANDIIVLTQTELVEWVLMTGLRAITEISRH